MSCSARLFSNVAKQDAPPAPKNKANQPSAHSKSTPSTSSNGLSFETLAPGRPDAKIAKANRTAFVSYVGRLQKSGKVFDQTRGNKTFGFKVGKGRPDPVDVIREREATRRRISRIEALCFAPQLAIVQVK